MPIYGINVVKHYSIGIFDYHCKFKQAILEVRIDLKHIFSFAF